MNWLIPMESTGLSMNCIAQKPILPQPLCQLGADHVRFKSSIMGCVEVFDQGMILLSKSYSIDLEKVRVVLFSHYSI